MSDEQVLEYIEQGVSDGKSQGELIQELAMRGVSRAQANRVRALYQSRNKSEGATVNQIAATREHAVGDAVDEAPETATDQDHISEEVAVSVFGRDIFRTRGLSFTPSPNMATPRNYRLGPGDEVIIDIFGANQTTIRNKISPEGNINVDILGPLYLNGMTIDQANTYLKKRLSSIYGGLNQEGESDIRLTLGQIRSIQVNVIGEVAHPGTYRMSAFSTVFHALYIAGGVVEPGSLRDIRIYRSGKLIGNADVYEYLMDGNTKEDFRLEEGDVIMVIPYTCMVRLDGKVKRPMYFELKPGQTLRDVIEYAGGFSNGAYTASATVVRQNGKSYEVSTVEEKDYGRFVLQDGDEISIGSLQSRFENRVSIIGSVFFPGVYEYGEVHTVRQIVEKAGGLLPEAFLGRAVIHREYPDRTKEVLSINLGNILDGTEPDMALQNNDELYIADGYDLKDVGTMTITGYVAKPGSFPFAENTTIEDLIIMAGGLRHGASTARVDVTRRKQDPEGLVATRDVAEIFSFSLKDGLIDDGAKGFVLEPYDVVHVHSNPAYHISGSVSVTGEVNFPGTYSLTTREERISELVAEAGGFTDFAYLKGARLIRRMSGVEARQMRDLAQAIYTQEEDIARSPAAYATSTYTVVLDLGKAVAWPGGNFDIVLRSGDVLEVPLISNVVRINGAVLAPTALTYDPALRAKDYIGACGGYAKRAMKRKAYVVNMNGKAQRLRRYTRIDPGAEIFVPAKEKREPNTAETRNTVAAYATASASMASMIVAMMSIIRLSK